MAEEEKGGMSEAATTSEARTSPNASRTSTVTAPSGRTASRTMRRASAIVTGCAAIPVVSLRAREPCYGFLQRARGRREADLGKLGGSLDHGADDPGVALRTRARGWGRGDALWT